MIDTKALRTRILSLAMQGKLTEQLSSDDSVEIIVEKCKTDKEKSINDGKYKKEEFFGALDYNDGMYDIPHNWKWMYIPDMSLFQEGPGILAKDFRKQGVPLIRIAGMNGNEVSLNGCNYLDSDMVNEKWSHFTLDYDDILISTSASLDRIAIVTDEAIGAIPYTGLIRFKMYGGINKHYFIWFVKSPYYILQVDNQKNGGFIQHYGPTHLRKMMIPIPPLAEQKRIVERVEEIFRLLDTIDQAQEKYSADSQILKAKLITAGIQGKLTEQLPSDGTAEELYQQIQAEKQKLIKEGKIKKEKPLPVIKDEEIPFEIPGSWKWCRLGEISNTIWAGRDKPNDFTEESDELRSVPVVANGVANDGILGYTGTATAPANTITVAGRGTIGFSVYRTYEYCPIVRLVVIEQAQQIEPRYLQYYLKLVPATSVGSSIPQLTVPMIRPKLVPLPPLAEQKRIVEVLERALGAVG